MLAPAHCQTDPMPLDRDAAELLEILATAGAPALSDGSVDDARRNYEAAPRPDR